MSVHVHNDRWIHTKVDYTTDDTQIQVVDQELRVEALIDSDMRWEENLIRQCITKSYAYHIIRIPIPLTEEPEKLIWPYKKDGVVSFKSVYHRLRKVENEENLTMQADGNRPRTLWSAIWCAKMISRINSYIWKLASNAIAVKANLIP